MAGISPCAISSSSRARLVSAMSHTCRSFIGESFLTLIMRTAHGLFERDRFHCSTDEPFRCRKPQEVGPLRTRPNPTHALDGGTPRLFHVALRWPAASDVH